jgi:2-polyprenyl-6-methoxyphenol hydroxylase-like FAD-dependent oxidoreductase
VRRYDRAMEKERPTSAIVLGAGISGLLAARALSTGFDEVAILEKRAIGEDGMFVQGVPQSEHLHVLLKRGQSIIDRIFPGLLAECASSTGGKNDWGLTTFWANPYGIHPQHESGVDTWQFSRDRLDRAILARVRALPNVSFESADVQGLIGDRSTGAITGVRIAARDGQRAREMKADLVVDCRGRTSPIVEELGTLGYPAPPMSIVDNEMGYSSQYWQLRPGERPDFKLVYVQVRPGLVDRGGALCEIEDGKLVATLIGSGAHRPESGQRAFSDFADSIGHEPLRAQLSRATPIGQPKLWRNLGNRRRHFGRTKNWPRGLVVLGDALCSFNPVYGQGMTVAAVEAEALEETLSSIPDPRAQRWEPAFQKRLEGLLFIPWLMSSTEDQRNRKLSNPRVHTRMLHGYLDLVLKSSVNDPAVHTTFLRIMHMMSSPLSLVAPGAVSRVGFRNLQRAFSGGAGPLGPGGGSAALNPMIPALEGA